MAMQTTLNEAEIKKAIVTMSNSAEYLALRKYYAEESFLKILSVSRDEKIHSNFIAWLLDPSSHHELNYFSLEKFLQMLTIVCKRDNNIRARFSDEYVERFLLGDYSLADGCSVRTEVPTGVVAGFDKEGRVDILIHLSFKGSDKILPVIIENKVLSTENDENTKTKNATKNKQTEKYFDWAEETYKDTDKYETPILIFLAPDFERDIQCKCEAFIKVSYQNLVDYWVEPCLMSTANVPARFFIENYLRCLSNSTLNNKNGKKEGRIMGFSGKEKELLEKFYAKNKDLFQAVLTMLATDDDLPDEDRLKMKEALAVASNHDTSEYKFDGQEYRKGRLVLAVVKKYVLEGKAANFAELKKAFPDSLRGGSGVVQLADKIPNKDKGIGGTKRYYTNDDERVELPSGEIAMVSNQWGGADKTQAFIDYVMENIGYPITKVN